MLLTYFPSLKRFFSHLCNFIVIEKKQEVHREVRSEVYIFIYRNERDAKFYLLRGP